MTTTVHTCNCDACRGLSFSAPEGFISGSPKTQRDMIHNYAHMVRNPVMKRTLERRGIKAVES